MKQEQTENLAHTKSVVSCLSILALRESEANEIYCTDSIVCADADADTRQSIIYYQKKRKCEKVEKKNKTRKLNDN